MFLNCKDIEEAHKLSALCFGIFNMKHIKGDTDRKTESINSGIFDEEAYVHIVKPRVRAYREKSSRSPIGNNIARKSAMLERIIKQRDEEQSVMGSYIVDGFIDFSKLPKIEPHVRLTLLRWLSKGMNSSDNKAKTEDGRVYTVIKPTDENKKCTLICDDGNLEMPPYIISFER